MKQWDKSAAYKQLKEAMLEDLRRRGLDGPQYTSKVKEYMQLWCWLQDANAAVKEYGALIPYQNGAAQHGLTGNKAVSDGLRISAQMLSVWTALGFRDRAKAGETVEDEEEL